MSDELRECPFCGGTETMAIWDGRKAAITCACSGTGPYMWMDARREAEGRQSDVVDDCTTMWNTRPVEDALRAKWASVPWDNLITLIGLIMSREPLESPVLIAAEELVDWLDANAPEEIAE